MELVDERIPKLRELLRVFPDETFTLGECLMFQDELFYDVLCKYVSKWCKGSGLPPEVIGGFEDTLEEFRLFLNRPRLLNLEEWGHFRRELLGDKHTDVRECIWGFIMRHRCCRPDVPGMIIQYKMLINLQDTIPSKPLLFEQGVFLEEQMYDSHPIRMFANYSLTNS